MLPDETIESTFYGCCKQFGGYDQLLVEQSDFRSGTSSRSIKLVHGGVRYHQRGIIEWEDGKMASFQQMGERYLRAILQDSKFGMTASTILEYQPKQFQFNGIKNPLPILTSLRFPSTSR